MQRIRAVPFIPVILFAAVLSAECQTQTAVGRILWSDPGNIRAKNLFWGPGGDENQPKLPVEFEREDRGGTSPKFDVRDATDKKWGAKMGLEPRPETAASRLMQKLPRALRASQITSTPASSLSLR